MNKFDQISRYSQPQFNAFQLAEILTDEDFAQNLPKDVLEAMKSGDLDKAMEKLKDKARDDEKLGRLMNQWLSEQANRLFKKVAKPARLLLSLLKQLLAKMQTKTIKAQPSESRNELSKNLKEEQIRKEIAKLNDQKNASSSKSNLLSPLKAMQDALLFSLAGMGALLKSLIRAALQIKKLFPFQKGSKFLEKSFAKAFRQLQSAFKHFQQKVFSPFANTVMKPFNWAGEKIQNVSDKFSKLASQLSEKFSKGAQNVRSFFQLPALFKNQTQKLASFSNRFQTAAQQLGQKIVESAKAFLHTLNPLNHLQPMLNRAKETARNAQQSVVSAVRSVQQTSVNAMQSVVAAAAFVAAPMVSLFAQARGIKTLFIKKGNNGKKFFRQSKERVFRALNNTMKGCKEMLKNAVFSVGNGLYEIIRLLQEILLDWMKNLKTWFKNFLRSLTLAIRSFFLLAMPLLWRGIKALPGLFKTLMMKGSAYLRKVIIKGLRRLEKS